MEFKEHDHDIYGFIGTGGSFIDCIFLFYFYFNKKQYSIKELEEKFFIIGKTGDCHAGTLSHHNNQICDLQLLNLNKKNIAINFLEENKEVIFDMAYNKLYLREPEKINEILNNKFNKNLPKKEKILKVLVRKNFFNMMSFWKENIDLSKMTLIIDFETIHNRSNLNLHDIIVNFLQVEKIKEVDNFIKNYQSVNSKYFNT